MIDHSLYPDVADPSELPESLVTDEDRADYIHRVCAAWDFDIYPERETFETLRAWKDDFDRCPLNDSPAYHEFRRRFGWTSVPMARNAMVRLTHEALDHAEGRGSDECARWV